MKRIFPNVDQNDRLTGVNLPGGVVRYFHNGKPIGDIADPGFSRAFFGIWLDPKTSELDFRQLLLGEKKCDRDRRAAALARRSFAYGLFGMPLAMAALPLYVHLPKFYGDHLGRAAGHAGRPAAGAAPCRRRARSTARRMERPRAFTQAADRAGGAAAGARHGRIVLAAGRRTGRAAHVARHRARCRLRRVQPGDDQSQRVGRGTVERSRRTHAHHRDARGSGAGRRGDRQRGAGIDRRWRRRNHGAAALRLRVCAVPRRVCGDHAGGRSCRGARAAASAHCLRGHGGTTGGPAFPAPAGRVHGQRHRLGHSRHARAVLHRRRAAGGRQAGPVPGALFHCRRRRHAAVGETVGARGKGGRMGRGDGRRDRRVRVGRVPWGWRRDRIRHRLRTFRPDARRRSRVAAVAARGCHRPRRTHAGRRRLFRAVDAGHQAQPGAGGRHRPAAARRARLCAWGARRSPPCRRSP